VNVVILHCHFERGGVTQVVENHVRWLRDCDWVSKMVLISGDRGAGLSDQTTASVTRLVTPDFDYDPPGKSASDVRARGRRMAQELESRLAAIGLSRDDCILHWHNHSLGKNTAAPAAIATMAESGWRILLQIHDFAEDSRPENYGRLITATGASAKEQIDRYLYPVASQIHYATLTRADAAVLARLGVPPTQTHCLPNSVVPPSDSLPDKHDSLDKLRRALKLPDAARWCVYPVRGIRRKNVGELLLLSRWMPADQFTGLTLCPATPVERRSYERWKQIAKNVAPGAVFDAGQDPSVSFSENLAAADYIVSTSVAEGFGMAFLEPWLVHRGVIARRLPTVTDDFQQCGVRLSHLYDAARVPGDQDWIRAAEAENEQAMKTAWSAVPPALRPSLGAPTRDPVDWIDFARLIPARQIEVLRRLATDRGFESSVTGCNRSLMGYLNDPPDQDVVMENANVVRQQYSPQATGQELLCIYQGLAAIQCDAKIRPPRHAGRGVDFIAGVRPFFPCRTEVIDG
jgi:hypothetical protein